MDGAVRQAELENLRRESVEIRCMNFVAVAEDVNKNESETCNRAKSNAKGERWA